MLSVFAVLFLKLLSIGLIVEGFYYLARSIYTDDETAFAPTIRVTRTCILGGVFEGIIALVLKKIFSVEQLPHESTIMIIFAIITITIKVIQFKIWHQTGIDIEEENISRKK